MTLTPLMWAVFYDNPDMVNIFLDFNADVNIRSVENKSAVDYAKVKINASAFKTVGINGTLYFSEQTMNIDNVLHNVSDIQKGNSISAYFQLSNLSDTLRTHLEELCGYTVDFLC